MAEQQSQVWWSFPGGIGWPVGIPLKGGKSKKATRKARKGRKATRKQSSRSGKGRKATRSKRQ